MNPYRSNVRAVDVTAQASRLVSLCRMWRYSQARWVSVVDMVLTVIAVTIIAAAAVRLTGRIGNIPLILLWYMMYGVFVGCLVTPAAHKTEKVLVVLAWWPIVLLRYLLARLG